MTNKEKASSTPNKGAEMQPRKRVHLLRLPCGVIALWAMLLPINAQNTSSPLSILQAAPRVRIDAREVVPVAPSSTPQTGIRQPFAPPVETDSQLGRRRNAATEVTPSLPRPGLLQRLPVEHNPPPEKPKKDGFVRGVIRAIPFVGPKIAGPKKPIKDQADSPIADEPDEKTEPMAEPETESDAAPLLHPIDDPTPVPSRMPSNRAPLFTKQPEQSGNVSADVLTVKVPAPETEGSNAASTATSNIVFESTPETPSSSKLAEATPVAVTTPTAVAVKYTSPTLVATDFGMPNPAYEQNEAIRTEYVEGVKHGREGNYPESARVFREYAANHPSSGLAPRALFLAALIDPDFVSAGQSEQNLKELFPKSHYVAEFQKRRPKMDAPEVDATSLNESPAQIAARLEQQLTENVGAADTEVPLRLRLGQAYMTMEQYDRALDVMLPAREIAGGKPEEPDILVLISECWIATRKNADAEKTLQEVLERFPEAVIRPRAAYDQGLVNEAAGQIERARALYSEVRLKWPGTPEATQAEERLKDLNKLAE
jgi:TolA-binding protein